MDIKTNIFFIAVLIFFSSCSKGNRPSSEEGGFFNSDENDVPYNVSKDLEAIKADGVLHAITIYNSTSYFLYKGMPMGFEYELLSRLADDLDL